MSFTSSAADALAEGHQVCVSVMPLQKDTRYAHAQIRAQNHTRSLSLALSHTHTHTHTQDAWFFSDELPAVAGRSTSSLASASPSSTLAQPPERDADGRGMQGAGGEWRREREREGTWAREREREREWRLDHDVWACAVAGVFR